MGKLSDLKEIFKPTKLKVIIFIAILILSNIPYVGLSQEKMPAVCTLKCVGCCSIPEYVTVFKPRAIFWLPFKMDEDVWLGTWNHFGGVSAMLNIQNSLFNALSELPFFYLLIEIFVLRDKYMWATELFFFAVTLVYWYLISGGIIYLYNNLMSKSKV